jgi:hypothetical protein
MTMNETTTTCDDCLARTFDIDAHQQRCPGHSGWRFVNEGNSAAMAVFSDTGN